MDLPTPVLAAVLGAIVSGVISIVVNIISYFIQNKINEENRREIREEQWQRDTLTLVRELNRQALDMDMGSTNHPQISSLIKDIESQIDGAPEETEQEIISGLENILIIKKKFNADETDNIKYRKDLIEKSEKMKGQLVNCLN